MSVETPEVHEASQTCSRCGARYTGGDACPSCGLLPSPVPCDDDPHAQANYRCVLCGRTVCGYGPSGKQAALCSLHSSIPVIGEWVQVYGTSDGIEADLIVQNLAAEGVDAQVYDQKDDNVFPVDLGELAVVRVLVPVWDYERAIELVQSYANSTGAVTFACPNCGEAFEPGQEQCGNCGASLIS